MHYQLASAYTNAVGVIVALEFNMRLKPYYTVHSEANLISKDNYPEISRYNILSNVLIKYTYPILFVHFKIFCYIFLQLGSY